MMAPRIITTQVESHAAVAAWLALPPQADGFRPSAPSYLELLHKSKKTSTYRLPQVGRASGDVIAKLAMPAGAQVERQVYPMLESLGCATIAYYGCVEAPASERCWLFLEDAAGERIDPHKPEHQRLAARWLARLHTASAALDPAPDLPARDAAHYLEHLRAARALLRRGAPRRALTAQHHTVLDSVHRALDRIETHWEVVEQASHCMPCGLVHADFVKKNVRIRKGRAGEATLLAFDWEISGWGLPAVDLALADLDVYHACVRSFWPHLTRTNLERLSHVGRLLRGCIAALRWEAECLETDWLDTVIDNMHLYVRRIAVAMAGLGVPS